MSFGDDTFSDGFQNERRTCSSKQKLEGKRKMIWKYHEISSLDIEGGRNHWQSYIELYPSLSITIEI